MPGLAARSSAWRPGWRCSSPVQRLERWQPGDGGSWALQRHRNAGRRLQPGPPRAGWLPIDAHRSASGRQPRGAPSQQAAAGAAAAASPGRPHAEAGSAFTPFGAAGWRMQPHWSRTPAVAPVAHLLHARLLLPPCRSSFANMAVGKVRNGAAALLAAPLAAGSSSNLPIADAPVLSYQYMAALSMLLLCACCMPARPTC